MPNRLRKRVAAAEDHVSRVENRLESLATDLDKAGREGPARSVAHAVTEVAEAAGWLTDALLQRDAWED
jgi:hypothetical protein